MVDKYPLGLNINMGAPRDLGRLVQVCQMLNSSHQMAMIGRSNDPYNDIKGVMALHSAIGDSALQWMIRVFSSREGNWREYNAQDYVDYCSRIHQHMPNTIFDAPSNEPGVKDNEIDAFIDNQIDLIEKFAARGIRYAACCYGVGSPHHEHITAGKYDRLLHALAEYDTAYLSEHHYTMGWLEAGSGFGYDILLDPAKLAQYWRTKWAVQAGHYLIRRSDYWALRADAIKIRRARLYATECPLDQIPDTVSQLNKRHAGAWDRMRNTYGLPQYNKDLRGVNSYEKFYKAVFPDLTYDEALAKIHIHYVEDCLYVDYIQAGFLFAWNVNWDLPEGSDYSVAARMPFFRLMSNHAKTYVKSDTLPPPQPEPEPQPAPIFNERYVQSTDGSGQNIRSQPVIADNIIGKLPAPPTIVMIQVSDAPPLDLDGMQWREIIYADKRGWVAFKYVRIVDQPPLVDYKATLIAAYEAGIDYHERQITDHANEVLRLRTALEQLSV